MAGEMADLSEKEQEIFNKEWDSFVATHLAQRDFVDIFEDNKEQILEACKIAKYQLECDFGGVNCKTNEFGWQEIHPAILQTSSSATTYSVNTWHKNYATSDVTTIWKDWIGTSSASLQLSKYATMIVIGFIDPVENPKVDAIKATIKGNEYPIWYMQNAMMPNAGNNNLHVYELPKPFVVEKEQNMYLQARIARAGDDELRPIGVYFGRGDHLRSKTAYAQI